MEHSFWHNAWQQGRTGWRQKEPGENLVKHWPDLAVPVGSTVLVPLCGDTPDMKWLLEQGYHVVGCDLSELGLQRFMQDSGLDYQRVGQPGLTTLNASGIKLIAGDFMSLTREIVGPIHAFFDRAATIALPPTMRETYAQQMASLTTPSCSGLLVSISYDQNEMKGPPFSVPDDFVHSMYESNFSIEQIAADANSGFATNLKDRGITQLTETVYRLQRH
jgi:thiopurine S-methyltransferase